MPDNGTDDPSANPEVSALAVRFGARARPGPYGMSAVFEDLRPAAIADGFAAPLPDLGLLAVTGEEAAKFLHTQLTNDVEQLADGEARWYGYCTAKGRMLASFLGWREADGVALAVSRALAEPIRKRLSMFVLRAKAKVLDRSVATVLLGVGGAAAADALEAIGLQAPAPMATARADGLTCTGLASVALDGRECPRWLLAIADERADWIWAALRDKLAPASTEVWRWTEVRSGVARVVAPTSELFVPQMVNFEVVGGVSFRKGCYPGQEVVARSHYLGKLKRRMFVGHLDSGDAPAPGADVMPAAGGEPCGQVVLAAPSPAGGVDLLFESQIAAVDAGSPSVDGRTISLEALPYAIPT